MQKYGRFGNIPKSVPVLRSFSLQSVAGFVFGILFMIIFFPPNLRKLSLSDHSIVALINLTRHISTPFDRRMVTAERRKLSLASRPKSLTFGEFIDSESSTTEENQHDDPKSHAENPQDDSKFQESQHDDLKPYGGITEKAQVLRPPRVLCWILTQPKNRYRAVAVQGTWAPRCDKYVFVSSENDTELHAIDAGLKEDRKLLWGKTKFGFRYAYDNFMDDFDWFMKADDDTYVVMENLKFMLSQHSPDEPVYFGSHFQKYMPQGYMSGGAGYVLSKKALQRLIEQGLNRKKCRVNNLGNEDVEMGRCLEKVGVKTGDSRDEMGQGRFFPQQPTFHLKPGHMNQTFWYGRFAKYPEGDFTNCCSDTAITFHYVKDMYLMEYLIYHLKPYKWPTTTNS